MPHNGDGLRAEAQAVASPGSSSYRKPQQLAQAASRYGASDDAIRAAASAVQDKGLRISVDPTRLFARVYGTANQWKDALGQPLKHSAGTASYPFDVYTLPGDPPFGKDLRNLEAAGSVYRKDLDGNRPQSATASGQDLPGATTQADSQSWPRNTGQPLGTACEASYIQARAVYTPSQVATAYGTSALARAAGHPAQARVAVVDLGGGYDPADLTAAVRCFGYRAPTVTVSRGDGVGEPIANASDETLLDQQTMAAVLPGATLDVIQTTNSGGSTLDAVSRALSTPQRLPDVITMSYGECALAEAQDSELVATLDDVLAMGTLAGASVFVAAGDEGSSVCGTKVPGASQSFPASSPWVTAVGGTRLILGRDNVITDEVTSGASPFVAANVALIALAERSAGRPALGLVNPWLYAVAQSPPQTVFDVTQGSNDLAGVGCCTAGPGYDLTTGLGALRFDRLLATLPAPAG